jgi:predicted RNA-binding Zn ribbon-like protein
MTLPEDISRDELTFRFMAGRVSLALTATVGERWRRSFERLREPADLARWLVEAGLIAHKTQVRDDQVKLARELREAIYRCARAIMAGEAMPRVDVARVNRVARLVPAAPQVDTHGRMRWRSEDPVAAALSVIARDAVDLFSGRWASRIRECASEECALLFVDFSRPGARRWCSSETCGTRARSAAYRTRNRQ